MMEPRLNQAETGLGEGLGQKVVVVVAHPDDEVLWLAAVLPRASKILVALPGNAVDARLERARTEVQASYPVAGLEFLPLSSAGVYKQSDYLRRRLSDYGVTLKTSCPRDRADHYISNFSLIAEGLESCIAPSSTVFTHNPWGEYGHEEHIQVSRAVLGLVERHGLSVWAWEGFSKNDQLASGVRTRADYFREGMIASLPSIELEVDLDLFRRIRELYMKHHAWTWDDDYLPPSPSRYVQLAHDGIVIVEQRRPPRMRQAHIAGQLITGRAKRYFRN